MEDTHALAEPPSTPTFASRDDGYTLAQLLVGVFLGTIVMFGVIALFVGANQANVEQQERTQAMSELESLSTFLLDDVSGGSKITRAEPNAFTIQRVMDEVCRTHAFDVADGTVTVTRTVFEASKTCTGGSVETTETVLSGLTGDDIFTYFTAMSAGNAVADPDLDDINRVAWDYEAHLPRADDVIPYGSAAAFTGRGIQDDGDGPAARARAVVLQVITDRTGVVGVDQPVLEWVDQTVHAVGSYSAYRVATAEGAGRSGSWELMTVLANSDPEAETVTLTWRDTTLAAGHTSQVIVRSNPLSGLQGPTSNQVATGLRPLATPVTATGQAQAIRVGWTRSTGATRYDVYRDGALYRRWSQISSAVTTSGSTISWIESTGYSNAHLYTVVPSNRWELGATFSGGASAAAAQTTEVGVGTQLTAALGGHQASKTAGSTRPQSVRTPHQPPQHSTNWKTGYPRIRTI